MAAVLNTGSGEPGKKQTNEGSVAIIQVKNDGGSDHHGSGGEVRNYPLPDVF